MTNTIDENVKIAQLACNILRMAVIEEDKKRILVAYDMVEDESFEWPGTDDCSFADKLYSDWDKLTDKANNIYYN